MKKTSLVIIFSFVYWNCLGKNEAAITTVDWNGRFGDQLVLYIKAKWLSYQFNVRFLYKSFTYSDQLIMHYKELYFQDNLVFAKKKRLKKIPTFLKFDTLYEIEYGFPYISWQKIAADKNFVNILKSMISPVGALKLQDTPSDRIRVALHIRKGTGFDWLPLASIQEYTDNSPSEIITKAIGMDQLGPLKYPPNQYYIDQIKWLSEKLLNVPLYVFVFTDDPNPHNLVNILQKHVNKKNILFDYRKSDNHHNKNVLNDFFSIAYNFDCFIRGGSNFAAFADLLGFHKVIIRPIEATWCGNKLIINKVNVVTKNSLYAELLGIPETDGATYFCPS